MIVPQGAEAKTWWRNFRTRLPVTIRLAGQLYDATAEGVERDDPR